MAGRSGQVRTVRRQQSRLSTSVPSTAQTLAICSAPMIPSVSHRLPRTGVVIAGNGYGLYRHHDGIYRSSLSSTVIVSVALMLHLRR